MAWDQTTDGGRPDERIVIKEPDVAYVIEALLTVADNYKAEAAEAREEGDAGAWKTFRAKARRMGELAFLIDHCNHLVIE